MSELRKSCIDGKLPPPVGTSDWATFSRDSRPGPYWLRPACVDGVIDVMKIGLAYRAKRVELSVG